MWCRRCAETATLCTIFAKTAMDGDKATTVQVHGEMGLRANMEDVEPIQLNERFEFRWFGVESARNAAQLQQRFHGVRDLPAVLGHEDPRSLLDGLGLGAEEARGPHQPL